jgi:hypothetical protein
LAQIETDEYLRSFQSYQNRYRTPYEQSYSFDPLYYSLDVGRASPLGVASAICACMHALWTLQPGI